MGGGSSSSDTNSTVRFAPYIESIHQTFLNMEQSYVNNVVSVSPYSDWSDIDIDSGFFGTGYLISSFPSLYDMYGKFMAGLDVETLWDQIFAGTVNSANVDDVVAAESALMQDDIDTNSMPKFQTGMRDIGAVMSSSYIVGKSIIYDAKAKALSKFDAELRYKLLPIAEQRWEAHLKWNQSVVNMYGDMMKLYISAILDVQEKNYSMKAKNSLWPFTVMDYERAALGALTGATNTASSGTTSNSGSGLSTAMSVLGMAAMVIRAVAV